MITPWEIYWVLQLDSVRACLLTLVGIGVVVTIVLALVGAMERASSHSFPDLEISKREAARSVAGLRFARRLAYFIVPLACISAFIPSTKTAAAMIVVPQIVNSPTIQHEAGDLYKLAKQALEQAIEPEHKK